MKRTLNMTGLLLVCAVLAVLGQKVTVPRLILEYPDLVVQGVAYDAVATMVIGHTGEYVDYEFRIVVQNIGFVDESIETTVAVLLCYDVAGTPSPVLFAAPTVPPIAAGASVTVTANAAMPPIPDCCVVVLVDAPVAGAPLGQQREGLEGIESPAEMNNGFAFFIPAGPASLTFKNPALGS